MAEGEHENKDELFEDLDKFFAPIQDVEWPEPETTAAPAAAQPSTPAGDDARDDDDDAERQTGVAAETIEIPDAEPERAPDAAAAPGEAAGAAASAAPPEESMEFEGVVVRPAGGRPADAEPADQRGEGEPPEDAWPAESEEPAGWPVEAHAAGAEEPSSGPSIDEVEAAAEHFAASVRAEATTGDETEPGPAPGDITTEPIETVGVEADAADGGVDAGPLHVEEDVERSLLEDLDDARVQQRTVVVGAGEGLDGPSWQEPTSVEVGAEHERADVGRDVPAAFITGLVLAAIALGSLAIGRAMFAVVASIIALVAMGELYAVMHRRHRQPATAVGLVTGALVLAAAYLYGEAAMATMIALGTMATFLWFMTIPVAHRKNLTASIGVTMLPVVYVAVLAGYALATVAIPTPPNGPRLVIAVIVLTFAYDAVAFAVGSFWGSRPLAQSISPRKSWEGVLAATILVIGASVVLSALFVPALDTLARSLGLAAVVSLFAPLGDLAESLLKRDLDVKDMGSILPGHGGVLDRIDSLLFVGPAAYLYFRIFL